MDCRVWDLTLEPTGVTTELNRLRARLVGDGADEELQPYLHVETNGVGVDGPSLDPGESIAFIAYDITDTGIVGLRHRWRMVPSVTATAESEDMATSEVTIVEVQPDAAGWLLVDGAVRWSRIHPDAPTVVTAIEYCHAARPVRNTRSRSSDSHYSPIP